MIITAFDFKNKFLLLFYLKEELSFITYILSFELIRYYLLYYFKTLTQSIEILSLFILKLTSKVNRQEKKFLLTLSIKTCFKINNYL